MYVVRLGQVQQSNKKRCINWLQLKPKEHILRIYRTRSNKINEWQPMNDQPHDPQRVS